MISAMMFLWGNRSGCGPSRDCGSGCGPSRDCRSGCGPSRDCGSGCEGPSAHTSSSVLGRLPLPHPLCHESGTGPEADDELGEFDGALGLFMNSACRAMWSKHSSTSALPSKRCVCWRFMYTWICDISCLTHFTTSAAAMTLHWSSAMVPLKPGFEQSARSWNASSR